MSLPVNVIISLSLLTTLFIEADEKYQWKKIPNNHSLKNPTNLLMKFRKRQTELLCSRSHNNTAYLGTKPFFSIAVSTIRQCRDTCLELYPYCVAAIFYKLSTLNNPLCYLFNKSSIHKDVILYPEKPLAEYDIINIIEIVTDCHEFDAVPPLSDTFTTSSDKVSRNRRATNFGNPIKRTGSWTRWTKCHNNTKYQIRSQPCEYGRIIQKRQCSNKSSIEISPVLYPSPFQPYPPQPYEHPDDKSVEYERRLAEHMKQLQRSRQHCCKRQEWYRKHVGKNYIAFCRHSCLSSDSLEKEQDSVKLSHNQQQQYIVPEEPLSRIQEYRKGKTDEIIMLPTPALLLPTSETSEWKNEQEQIAVKTYLPGLNGKTNADLPEEVQTATRDHQNHVRKYEEEYFHDLQSQLDKTIKETTKPILHNNEEEETHQPVISQDYHGHEEHDDYYQQHQQRIENYPQQGEFQNEHSTFEEEYYPKNNKNQEGVPSGNDDAGESEFDGTDYGYDYDSQEETPVTVNQKQIPVQETTSNQFPYQTYPYNSRDESFSTTLLPMTQGEDEQHYLTGSSINEGYYNQQQERSQHLGVPSDDIDRQQQEQQEFSTVPTEDYHREQQVHPQPSESEFDEYYRRRQQQDFSTVPPEDYHSEQQVRTQPSESELDEYYRRQQQQEFSTVPPEDYHSEQQVHPQPSESELDEYYRRQQQQDFSAVPPEDYHREQEVHPQPSESELDQYYRRQQQQEFSTIPPEDYHREQQVHPQPSESELDEYYRRQQQQDFSTVPPEDYHREQEVRPQPSGSELDEYYRREQSQQTDQQPSGYPSDDYYRQQQEQQELSKFPLKNYHREQEARPQPSVPLPDDYYRHHQQQYIGETHEDSWAAQQHYPDSNRDVFQEQPSSNVQDWNPWTTWSICPITCGDSVQTRRRTCPAGNRCYGETTQQRPCHFRPCGMQAEWSDWCHCVGH